MTTYLLVEDDLTAQGLGFTSEWLILALLWAVRERRVLTRPGYGERVRPSVP